MSKRLAHKQKPLWRDAPLWANYLAMDGCGEWYWYESEPSTVSHHRAWTSTGRCENARPRFAPAWNNSLESRP